MSKNIRVHIKRKKGKALDKLFDIPQDVINES